MYFHLQILKKCKYFIDIAVTEWIIGKPLILYLKQKVETFSNRYIIRIVIDLFTILYKSTVRKNIAFYNVTKNRVENVSTFTRRDVWF